MEELTAIKTAEGREFKPWATKEKVMEAVAAAVQDPASVTAVTSEVAAGKAAIASAINAKGGDAEATESFAQLAQDVEAIPNYLDMVKLAGIIAGGNYNKNALQGHNENVKYGKTEIIDNVGAFEKININYCFKYWDLLKRVTLPALAAISGSSVFERCSSLQSVTLPALTVISGGSVFDYCESLQRLELPNLTISSDNNFSNCTSLREIIFPNLTTISGNYNFNGSDNLRNVVFGKLTSVGDPFYTNKPNLRNITIGQDTNVKLPFSGWTARNVIAEGQSGIAELNSNLYNNLLTKLYDHSNDGVTRTLRIGWLANVTADNIAYANAKGWTLTT